MMSSGTGRDQAKMWSKVGIVTHANQLSACAEEPRLHWKSVRGVPLPHSMRPTPWLSIQARST
jgi:hypothetical protein